MNAPLPGDTGPDELEARYREASTLAGGRPSDAAREAILAQARARLGPPEVAPSRRAQPRLAPPPGAWAWRLAASLAFVGLAGLMYMHLRQPPASPTVASTAAPAEMTTASPVVASARPADAATALRDEPVVAPPPPAAVASQPAPAARAALASKQAVAAAPAADGLRMSNVAELAAPAAGATVRVAATPLLQAASTGDCATVGALIDSGAAPDERDASGRTPLLIATLRGSVDCVRRLLAAGADPEAPDAQGDTPRAAARRGGSTGIDALYGLGTKP